MQVSVIIPVYNAVDYVREAVESALAQPETAEVLLIEDGSPYGDLAVCEQLAAEFPQILLYRHPNGENRGPGPSRNLGIQQSKFEYIAFLDADDFYLPRRFETAFEIFESDPQVDGVYEAIGTLFQNEESRLDWQALRVQRGLPLDGLLTTVKQVIPPDSLFEHLVVGKTGYFSGDGLVVKRTVFENAGLFSPIRHEDFAMWVKLAATSRLVVGKLSEPVAMRRVYGTNRTIELRRDPAQAGEKLIIMWETLWHWSLKKLPYHRQSLLIDHLMKQVTARYDNKNLVNRIRMLLFLMRLIPKSPQAVLKPYFGKKCLRQFWPSRI
jgi:glycosyltransferase involved in cell wall biosynthesis